MSEDKKELNENELDKVTGGDSTLADLDVDKTDDLTAEHTANTAFTSCTMQCRSSSCPVYATCTRSKKI